MASKAVENRLRSLNDVKNDAARITFERLSREQQDKVLESRKRREARAKAKAAKAETGDAKPKQQPKKAAPKAAAKAETGGEGSK